MAIKPKQPGSNIVGAFSVGLADVPDLGEEFVPNSSYHLPAYTLSLKDLNNLQNAKGIDGVAREVAWQCLALSKTGKVIMGEVSPVHKAPRPSGRVFDGPVRMTSLSHGEIINGAFDFAKGLNARQEKLIEQYNLQGDYEPRMLRIPGLLVTAVWLKSATPDGTDWVVPIHTKISDLQNKEMYTMDEFIAITRDRAQERLQSTIFD